MRKSPMSRRLEQLEEIISKASNRIEKNMETKAKRLLNQILNKMKINNDNKPDPSNRRA